MLADRLPKFIDPAVNAYIKELTQFKDRYVAAVVAARHGDDRALKRMDAAFPELQAKAVLLFDKLEPGETKRFTEYVTACGQTMVDAAYELGPVRSARLSEGLPDMAEP